MHQITPTAEAAVTEWFEENFRERGEIGASVSIWQDGREVIRLSQGFCDKENTRIWQEDTLVPVFSSTKAPAAICCLMALEKENLSLEQTVATLWPEFAQGGKGEVTFRHLLTHRAGLSALDERVPINDYAAVIQALEKQTPLWEPGCQQGYHARTFGFLMDEIVRRITGAQSLGAYFQQSFKELDLDFWIGLPESEHYRVSPVYPGRIGLNSGQQAFFKAFTTPGTLTQRTFISPVGLNAVSEYNSPALWSPGYASMGGVGSARGLGKFYAMLAQGGQWQGRTFVSESIIQQLTQPLSQAEDSVLLAPIAFAAGVMQDPLNETGNQKLRQHYGPSLRAFGHPGAGGSLSLADPENRISLAYVMNQMEVGALPGPKVLGLVERLYW
jgi:CubicO group peptidase (beta-lactamase class C family)